MIASLIVVVLIVIDFQGKDTSRNELIDAELLPFPFKYSGDFGVTKQEALNRVKEYEDPIDSTNKILKHYVRYDEPSKEKSQEANIIVRGQENISKEEGENKGNISKDNSQLYLNSNIPQPNFFSKEAEIDLRKGVIGAKSGLAYHKKRNSKALKNNYHSNGIKNTETLNKIAMSNYNNVDPLSNQSYTVNTFNPYNRNTVYSNYHSKDSNKNMRSSGLPVLFEFDFLVYLFCLSLIF